MTKHFPEMDIEQLTVEDIISAWIMQGRQIPKVYGIFSEADWAAYNCWLYLAGDKKITIDEFIDSGKMPPIESKRIKFKELLTQCVELSLNRAEPI